MIEPDQGDPIPGLRVPEEFYWVLRQPAPLAGMRYPRGGCPWKALLEAGFTSVLSLHCGLSYNPAPLTPLASVFLEDLVHGGPPGSPESELSAIQRAVDAVIARLEAGQGVVVHCYGGRGRTGTVIGCVLRRLGYGPHEVVDYLDRLHTARGKGGWPESPWQEQTVRECVRSSATQTIRADASHEIGRSSTRIRIHHVLEVMTS